MGRAGLGGKLGQNARLDPGLGIVLGGRLGSGGGVSGQLGRLGSRIVCRRRGVGRGASLTGMGGQLGSVSCGLARDRGCTRAVSCDGRAGRGRGG